MVEPSNTDDRLRKVEELLAQIRNEEDALSRSTWLYLKRTHATVVQILTFLSTAEALANERFERALPCYIFVADNLQESPSYLKQAAQEFARVIGFEVLDDGYWQLGSWMTRWVAKALTALSKREVQERLAKAERALELQHIESVQAKIDNDLAQSAVTLATALEKCENAVISFGPLFAAKSTVRGKSKVLIKRLTNDEMQIMHQNPKLWRDPVAFQLEFPRPSDSPVRLEDRTKLL